MLLNTKNYIYIFIIIFAISIHAQEKLRVGNVYPGEIEMGGFNLLQDATIEIEGKGASYDKWENYLCYYAWIIKTDTREVIWRSQLSDDYLKSDGEYDFSTQLDLKAGNYEVYYTGGRESEKIIIDGIGMIQGLFDGKKSNIYKFNKEYFISISDNKNLLKIVSPIELVNKRDNGFVSLLRVGDSENLKKGFSLNAETKVSIFGIGEGIRDEFYDFGYIYDVSQNKKVWMFNKSNSTYAGGGKKNLMQKAEITLPKGSYTLNYKSDDSHSYDEWNVLPPDDPQYWGIVVSLVNKNDVKNVIPFRKSDIATPLVDLTKIEEDELVSQGFSILSSVDLRVLALGEGKNNLADYGWIENADTKELYWKMTGDNTEYAGGATKNRISDEIVKFKPGNYIAYYITDDSHNYDDWNDTPPYDEDKWGISIWTTSEGGKSLVKLFNANTFKSKNLISEIIKVGDDQNLSKRFNLSESTDVRIIAYGEASGREFVDYSWITNKSGKTVWEMKYNETSHAGGGSKNRIFNSVISLKEGEYKLHCKTDDSHSFEEWNTSPPDNPHLYGVTILKEK